MQVSPISAQRAIGRAEVDCSRIDCRASYLAHLSPKLRVQHCVRQLAYSATLCTGAERLAFAVIARAIMDAAGLVDCEKLELRQRVQSKAVQWLSQIMIDAAVNIDLEPEYIRQTMRAYGVWPQGDGTGEQYQRSRHADAVRLLGAARLDPL